MKLSACIHQYFDQYLLQIIGASDDTIKSYRSAFTLFLSFAAQHLSVPVKELNVEHLTPTLIFAFLEHLEDHRNNLPRSRNSRLAAIKSLFKMIRLMHPEYRKTADRILNIPQKRFSRPLIGYMTEDEILKVFQSVDLKRKQGFRDYTILHLLYDSGARASEMATLNLGYFDPQKRTLAIVGKGNRYRLIQLWPKTTQLLNGYIEKYRLQPKSPYMDRMFINQRREEFTRHGIHRLCKKYLTRSLPAKRIKDLNPAHSFRHSRAVNMLSCGASITDIKNHLGHANIESTMVYLQLNLTRKREVQKQFIKYTQSILPEDPKFEELLDWENKQETLNWLDSL
ncbi:MAG TPA: integrase [Nitrospirae bacterium]|nr:integrase [Nitrospirota bacterium]